MNSSKIIEDQIKTYRDNFLIHKDSPLGTYQNDRTTQHLRFERIIRPFRTILKEDVSFHDFGCGVCDLHQYFINYSGTEVIDEMINHARIKFPGIRILKRDILLEPDPEKFDIVVFSGGLYLPGNIPLDEWRKFVFAIVDKMFDSCKVGISFNLLSTYNTYQGPNLFFLDPREMFDYCCKKFSRFVQLDQSYPLYEWTVSVFRKEFILEQYPQQEFAKYLK